VTLCGKLRHRARPDASVEQQLHATSMTGSTRSRPTSLRA
jgi:hypothetical protein